MGTRSLTYVKENGKNLLCIYRQFDGYPEGIGADIFEFLNGFEVVNRYGAKLPKLANGMGCLAAQLVGALKDGVGNVYIYPADSKDVGEQFTYTIELKKGKLNIKVVAVCGDKSGKTLFNGSIADFGLFLNIPKKVVADPKVAY